MVTTTIFAICMALTANAIYSHAKPYYGYNPYYPYYSEPIIQQTPLGNKSPSDDVINVLRQAPNKGNNNANLPGPALDQGNNPPRQGPAQAPKKKPFDQGPAQAPSGNNPFGQGPAQAPSGNNPFGQGPAQAPSGNNPFGQGPAQAPSGNNGFGQGQPPSWVYQSPQWGSPPPWAGNQNNGYQPNPFGGPQEFDFSPSGGHGFHEDTLVTVDDKLRENHNVGIGLFGYHLADGSLNRQRTTHGDERTITHEESW